MARTRLSAFGLIATASTAIGSAGLVVLSAGIAFAGGPSEPLDLPIQPPVLQPATTTNNTTTPGPQTQTPPPPKEQNDTPPPTFFGQDVKPETPSIVYVIDQSGSMSLSVQSFTDDTGNTVQGGNRLDRAKSELRRSIGTLPETFKFNVIFYDECIRCWQSQTVPASTANKQASFGWINGQQPMGFTNTGLAVATALAEKTNKLVVLLSDGEPNFLDCAANYVGTYQQHRQMIRQTNTQSARVDCFGIGVESNPDARRFMQDVAGDNNGNYTEAN